MAIRIVNGNDHTEDGWPLVDQDGCNWITVPGTDVRLQIQKGQPTALLGAWAADWHAYIERLRDADSACWTETNDVLGRFGENDGSNHLGGTAIDLNWRDHPFRQRGSLNAAQMAVMAEMEDFYEGTVFWAGRWDDPADEMHSQCGYNSFNNPHTQDFINRKIRPDGFSTFRRGDAPPAPPVNNAAEILTRAMGGRLAITRYAELLPAVSDSLTACDCNNVNRIAMWVAQIGHESGGLFYTEEIASGEAYEGRTDLGNTQPGDGVRFKGRSWIQITGRNNYTKLSQWAHGKGLVPSPTFFVDNPTELASDQYAGLGAAWYWVVARPDINALSDQRDLETVTRRINGGLNGIDDRRSRYDRALAMGDQLLTLTTTTTTPPPAGDDMALVPQDQWDRVYRELTQRLPSRSPLRHLGEGTVDTLAGMLLNVDSSVHVQIVELLASLGHPPTLALLREVAAADPGKYPDRQEDRSLALAILARVTNAPTAAPTAPISPVVLAPLVHETPEKPTTGQLIVDAFNALEKLLSSDVLTDSEKAAFTALTSVLQTKTQQGVTA